MENQRYYVYGWFDNKTGNPVYVGKGSGNRYLSTNRWRENEELCLYAYSHEWTGRILIPDLSEDKAFELEKLVIKTYKNAGFKLFNKTNGGKGVGFGREITDQYRLKYHYMCLGDNNPNYGNHWTQKQRDHLSEVRIKNGLAKYGNNPRARAVTCVETGKVYSCQQEAANDIGLKNMASISHALKEKRFVAKGLHFVAGPDIIKFDTEEKRMQYLRDVEMEKVALRSDAY